MIQLTLTLKMTTAQVVETSVTVNNNSPFQDYVHPDDQTQPTFEMTPGFKPFTRLVQMHVTVHVISTTYRRHLPLHEKYPDFLSVILQPGSPIIYSRRQICLFALIIIIIIINFFVFEGST